MTDKALIVRKTTLRNIFLILIWFTPYFMYAYIPSGRDVFVVMRLLVNLVLIYNTGVFRNIKQPLFWLVIGISFVFCIWNGICQQRYNRKVN